MRRRAAAAHPDAFSARTTVTMVHTILAARDAKQHKRLELGDGLQPECENKGQKEEQQKNTS